MSKAQSQPDPTSDGAKKNMSPTAASPTSNSASSSSVTSLLASSSSSSSSQTKPLSHMSAGEIRSTLLSAIAHARAERQRRTEQGLSSDSSSSESDNGNDNDSDNDDDADASKRGKRSHTTATPSSSQTDASSSGYGQAAYWDQRYAKTRGQFDWYVEYAALEAMLDEYGAHIVRMRDNERRSNTNEVTNSQAQELSSASDHQQLPHAAAHSDTNGTVTHHKESVGTLRDSASTSSPSTLTSPIPYHRAQLRVLDVGCGNSQMGPSMYRAGWHQITHIDISSVCIEAMRTHYANEPEQCGQWITMDATKMTFDDESFDIVIDKGTLDALDCTNSGEEENEGKSMAEKLIAECERVLRPHGVFVLVTHGSPRWRLPMLLQPHLNWSVKTKAMPYSTSALFIRLLRRHLKGQPLSFASKSLIAMCGAQVRMIQKQLSADLEHAQSCIASVEAEYATSAASPSSSSSSSSSESAAALSESERRAFAPNVTNICLVYVCTKRRPRPDATPSHT